MKRPNSLRHLDDAIRRLSGGSPDTYVRTRTVMASAIVAQMIPNGVLKGGSALKVRYGNARTRFTTDLDAATATDPEEYAAALSKALEAGWEGFTGTVVPREPAHPKDVPTEYVMRPFSVKLSYNGKPWCTVPLEVGHNEIGDADEAEWVELADASDLLEELGFPRLGPAPLMPLQYQVAQKLHGATSPGDRARDLIDLQLIMARSDVDLRKVKEVCQRLFAYRKKQLWPPVVVLREGWSELYAAQAQGLDVLPDAEAAVDWANGFIARIDAS